jgi:hypothetical protein
MESGEVSKVKAINSVSGGKTSAYMYLNYPTDYSIFACVLSKHPTNKPSDIGVLRECQNRVPWFEGSMELEQTLKAVLEVEQLGGKEIKWVAADFTFEDFVKGTTDLPKYQNPMLPNSRQRFCTEQLKLVPIFNYCYSFLFEPNTLLLMNIGFRFDEAQRVAKYDNGCRLNYLDFPYRCVIDKKAIYKYKWKRNFYWRELNFPLFSDKVTKDIVNTEILKTGITFPEVSNCAYCFFHKTKEHQLQFEQNPEQVQSWLDLESYVSNFYGETKTFHAKLKLSEIIEGLDNKVSDNTSGCFCTE